MKYDELIEQLRALANPKNVEGMARYGINPENTLGISIPNLRSLAKKIGTNHPLALKLWNSGIHEAKILAGFMDDSHMVTAKQMDNWVKDFDSWDVCDQVCMNLFDKTCLAYLKAVEWSAREETFVKRAGFALMASLAFHDKKAKDKDFIAFLPIIKREAADERNYVKKAVNWALRQIGKRNAVLHKAAIKTAQKIQKIDSRSARWIASDAIRELTNPTTIAKLKKK